jgi:putative endonuclease
VLVSAAAIVTKGSFFCLSFRRRPESRRRPGESREPEIKCMIKQPAVYILASERDGTPYIGVTSDLVKRIWEHKNNLVEGFTKRYSVHHLVWYELYENMASAIEREKRLKEWKRAWKLKLIEGFNPGWQDLYDTIA